MNFNFCCIFLIFFLFSCSTSAYKEANVLDETFSNAKEKFKLLDPEQVKIAFAGYKTNIKLVKNCVDSVEEDFVRNFKDYKTIKKASPKFFDDYKLCEQNILFEEMQLKNLKHDIKNEFLEKDSIDYYLTLEQKNVDQIIQKINETATLYYLIKRNNDSLYPYVKRFAEKYCNK